LGPAASTVSGLGGFSRHIGKDAWNRFLDLAMNRPLTPAMIEMGMATRHIFALNTMLSETMKRWVNPLERREQKEVPHDHYIAGGFVENRHPSSAPGRSQSLRAPPSH